jgi:hypothetical protein
VSIIALGLVGTRHEAETIKQQLADFLKTQLRLELSDDKTLITHARSAAARFLGYHVTVMQDNEDSSRLLFASIVAAHTWCG